MSGYARPFSIAVALAGKGHSPMPLRPASQAPFLPDWTRLCSEPLRARTIERYARSAVPYNVGIALGYRSLIAVDRDTDDAAVIDALRPVIRAIYRRGGVPVAKFGSKGRTSFFRWNDPVPFRNRSFLAPQGSPQGTLFELSGPGRSTTLPPSIHPKSGNAYVWSTPRTLLDTSVEELPELTAADISAIEAALSPFLPRQEARSVSGSIVRAADLTDRDRQRQRSYAQAIIREEASTLATMPPNSGRNRAVFNLACRVGRFVTHGIMEPRQVIDPIMRACEANGLTREDGRAAVLQTINSGLSRATNDELPDLCVNGGHC